MTPRKKESEKPGAEEKSKQAELQQNLKGKTLPPQAGEDQAAGSRNAKGSGAAAATLGTAAA